MDNDDDGTVAASEMFNDVVTVTDELGNEEGARDDGRGGDIISKVAVKAVEGCSVDMLTGVDKDLLETDTEETTEREDDDADGSEVECVCCTFEIMQLVLVASEDVVVAVALEFAPLRVVTPTVESFISVTTLFSMIALVLLFLEPPAAFLVGDFAGVGGCKNGTAESSSSTNS